MSDDYFDLDFFKIKISDIKECIVERMTKPTRESQFPAILPATSTSPATILRLPPLLQLHL